MERWTTKDFEGNALVYGDAVYESEKGVFRGYAIDHLAYYEDLEEQDRLIMLPCKVGDTVYRICPKCNTAHDGSCDHCAWQATGGISGCDVFGLWNNGSYDAHHCTIVPWKATYHRMPTITAKLGTRIFLSRADAEVALKDAEAALKGVSEDG